MIMTTEQKQVATFYLLVLALVVNLLVLVQNWQMKSRVFRLESAVFAGTTNSKEPQPKSPQ